MPGRRVHQVAAIPPVEALLLAQLKAQHEIVSEVRALREVLTRDRRPLLSREDRVILRRILPAIVGVRRSERLTSRDLVEDDTPAIRLAVGSMTAKQIGKLFARAASVQIDGLMVQKDGVDFRVTAWRIVGC